MTMSDLPLLPIRVRDDAGVPYDLSEDTMLGRPGGFGAVFSAGNFAVKIFRRGSEESPETLKGLGQLPIHDLQVARFVRTVEGDWAGYVMELVPGMVPWYPLVAVPQASFWEWWDQFGGYRRRLALCTDLARTMSQLAQRGLVFADLNYNNVLFNHGTSESSETWLIDIDNLRFGASRPVAFPGYGAPELMAGRARQTTQQTDVWSLAVLVFTTLTTVHPFEAGSYVHDGSPGVEQQQAWRGEVPWIDDPDEDWNRTRRGLDRRHVLTRRLQHLFSEMFGPGRTDPTARPSVGDLHGALELTSLLVVTCPSCSQTTLARQMCPFCDAPIDTRLIAVQRQPLTSSEWAKWSQDDDTTEPGSGPPLVRPEYIALTDGDVKTPPAWVVSYELAGPPVISLKRSRDRLQAQPLRDDVPVWYRKGSSSWKPLRGDTVVGASDDWAVRIGPERGPYTVLRPPHVAPR